MVVAAEIDFLIAQEDAGAKLAVLEIPLLFETGAEQRVDVTIALTAPAHVQRERVLARPGMTVDKLEHLLARQLADAERAGARRLRCGQRHEPRRHARSAR